MQNLLDDSEDAFNNCYFTHCRDISQEEMNITITAMQPLVEDMNYDFDDPIPKFILHRLDSDDFYHWVSESAGSLGYLEGVNRYNTNFSLFQF